MKSTNRKLIAFIIAVVFLLAAFGALAWATSGFVNWNAATWFNSWGKGSSSAVVIVENTSARVRTSSTDVDHEIIMDSEDGSTTFATTKLPTPYFNPLPLEDRLAVCVSSLNVGTVKVYMFAYYGGAPTTIASFVESDFVSVSSYYAAYISYSTLREKFGSNVGNPNTSYYYFYAENVNKSGYLDSNSSSDLYLCNISEITTEFTNTSYKIKCDEEFYNSGYYSLNVCSSDNISGGGTSIVYGNSILNIKGTSYVTYSDGYICVDLLSLTNDITSSLDVYYFSFAYDFYTSSQGKRISSFSRKHWNFNTFSISHLPAPTNLTYNAGTLTWDSVPGATKYGVFWTENDSEKKAFVDTTSYTFDINALGVGEHTVRVRALGNLGQTAVDSGNVATLSAFNAGNVITQVVALTYNVDGDVVTKFVPYGKNIVDYLYDVNIENKEFGGWFYDSGFSVKVGDTDVLDGDKTVYARISDKAVEEVPQTVSWWDIHKWQVLIPCFVFVGLLAIGIAALVVKKKKHA